MPLRILVADDHVVVRAGLRAGLLPFDILVVGEAERGDDLFPLLHQTDAGAILLDIRLPGSDGLTILSRLRTSFPQFPVVMMTGYDNPGFMAEAIDRGAVGYLTKDLCLDRFAEVLHAAAAGKATFTRDDLRRITGAMATPRLGPEYDVPLTHRECEVLRSVGDGMTNKEIAERLGISFETVKEHVQHILRKIGVVDRTQVVYWAMRNGLIAIDGEHP